MWIDFERIGETTEFKAELPKGIAGIKLYRRDREKHIKHKHDNNYWNTSGNLTISDANDCLTFINWNENGTGWKVGNYSK